MFNTDDPITVLVVDDDPSILKLLEHNLQQRGFIVETANNGVEGFAIANEVDPPLVITDWNMPQMNGLELTKRLRSCESIGFTYIILLTVNTTKEQLAKGFEVGVDDYITKPFDYSELFSRIKSAERIIRLEAFYRKHMVQVHKTNAEVAMMNSRLERISRQREQAMEEAKVAKAMADTANMAKSDFIASMSHEVRSPMTSILGYAELLQDQENTPIDRETAIEAISRNGLYLLSIINDILDISKIEAGKMQVECIPCSPCEIINDVMVQMWVKADEKNISLNVEYVGKIPETIQSDPIRLRQILINLIGNAVKFTEQGGVRLVVQLDQSQLNNTALHFDIIDTGIGLTSKQADRLFKTYSQADPATTRLFGGSGLGLSISRKLAELLGGKIKLINSKPSEGSQFRIILPTGSLANCAYVQNPSSQIHKREHADSKNHSAILLSNYKILLVEDHPDNQQLVSLFLSKAGAKVEIAANGRQAIEAAMEAKGRQKPFDVILMDMQMPILDGYEATRRLRANGYTDLIIALTAHAMVDDQKKCLDCGCDAYISKPVTRYQLIDSIHKLLQSKLAVQHT